MKNQIRALGIDDSYFVPHIPGEVEVVGVLLRAPNYFEGMLIRNIHVDSMDATDAIMDMLSSKYGKQVRVIFTQGITLGGFNIIDIKRIWEESRIPVIVVSRKMPDISRIEDALKKHFDDWEERMEIMRRYPIKRVKNGRYEIFVQHVGIDEEEMRRAISLFTVRGAIPEPLRVAHLIASAIHFGESRGKP